MSFNISQLLSAGTSLLTGNVAGAASNGAGFLANLFGGGPNPNDWKGWDALDSKYGSPKGWQAVHWTVNDGDSISNEAGNIRSYINGNADGLANMLAAASLHLNLDEEAFMAKLYSKFQRGGISQAATDLQTQLTGFLGQLSNGIVNGTGNPLGSNNPTQQPYTDTTSQDFQARLEQFKKEEEEKQRKQTTWIIIGGLIAVAIVCAVVYFTRKTGK